MQLKSSDEQELKKDLHARLVVLGGEQEERLAQERARTLGVPYISLLTYPVDPDVLEQIPKTLAREASAVLFYKQGHDIRLGVVNPHGPALEKIIKLLQNQYQVDPQLYVVSHRSVASALARYRRERAVKTDPADEMRLTSGQSTAGQKDIADLQQLGANIAEIPPTELLTMLVAGAVAQGASDIHIEPSEHETRLRYRIDGVLQDITSFALVGYKLVLSRVKVLAKLKLNIKDVPQDGSFVLRVEEATYDMRVSLLPGGYGENIVIRILNRASEVVQVTDLGLKPRDFELVKQELKRTNGLILTTGPTGSGKTTTLASFVREINTPDLKIITLEDPIEYRIAGVSQTEVDAEAGYTFAKGLRAILRQDPDIILVGEMRDMETAETAMHAALTGHLVFSTLHTNDAPGAIVRLLDMGIKPLVIAPAINLVIAQRLVRIVCKECAEEYTVTPDEREKMQQILADVADEVFDKGILQQPKLTLVKAKGCSACHGSGYKGRIGIFEIFAVTGKIEELILKGADGNSIREAAIKSGMTTLAQDGYLKVLDKMTTFDEVARVSEE